MCIYYNCGHVYVYYWFVNRTASLKLISEISFPFAVKNRRYSQLLVMPLERMIARFTSASGCHDDATSRPSCVNGGKLGYLLLYPKYTGVNVVVPYASDKDVIGTD